MEESFVLSTKFTDFLQWLDDPYFVVDMDDAAHQGVWSQGLPQVLDVENTCFVGNWEVGYFKAIVLKSSAGVEDTLVINLSCDDMSLLVTIELRHTLQS